MIRFGTVTIDRKRKVISNGMRQHQFGDCNNGNHAFATFELLQHLLLAGGKTSRELFDLIYGNDPNGGPLGWWTVINVLICQRLQKTGILEKLGMDLRAEKCNGLKRYWVIVHT